MPREEGEIPKTIRKAVNNHCRECNDCTKSWHEDNDCTVWRCWLYPYRPGTGGEDRVVRKKRVMKHTNISALVNYRQQRTKASRKKGD